MEEGVENEEENCRLDGNLRVSRNAGSYLCVTRIILLLLVYLSCFFNIFVETRIVITFFLAFQLIRALLFRISRDLKIV